MIYSIVETTIETGTVPAFEDCVKDYQKRKKVSLRAFEFLGQREEEELKEDKEMSQDESQI